MALSDCVKCWDTPCTCGHGYSGMSEQKRFQIACSAAPEIMVALEAFTNMPIDSDGATCDWPELVRVFRNAKAVAERAHKACKS